MTGPDEASAASEDEAAGELPAAHVEASPEPSAGDEPLSAPGSDGPVESAPAPGEPADARRGVLRNGRNPAEGPERLPATSCPYLEVAGERWRHATPSRDHRCTAIRPPAPLTVDKQRRLCL